MKDDLVKILSFTNDWLRFAEAKNAGLLAFSVGLGSGVMKFVTFGTQPVLERGLLAAAFLALGLAAAVAMISFLPKLNLGWLHSQRPPSAEDNVLFFGSAAYYSPSEYLKALAASLHYQGDPSEFEKQCAAQIVANGRIALAKYAHFSAGVRLSLAAIVLLLAAGAMAIIK